MKCDLQIRERGSQAQSIAVAKLIESQSRKEADDVLSGCVVSRSVDRGQAEAGRRCPAADFLHAQIAAAARMIVQYQMIANGLGLGLNAIGAVDGRHDVINGLYVTQIDDCRCTAAIGNPDLPAGDSRPTIEL